MANLINTIELKPPYLVFLGDVADDIDAKTALGIAHSGPSSTPAGHRCYPDDGIRKPPAPVRRPPLLSGPRRRSARHLASQDRARRGGRGGPLQIRCRRSMMAKIRTGSARALLTSVIVGCKYKSDVTFPVNRFSEKDHRSYDPSRITRAFRRGSARIPRGWSHIEIRVFDRDRQGMGHRTDFLGGST